MNYNFDFDDLIILNEFEESFPRFGLIMDQLKAERMRQMLLKKKECDKIAMDIVLRLIEPNVDKDLLLQKVHRFFFDFFPLCRLL